MSGHIRQQLDPTVATLKRQMAANKIIAKTAVATFTKHRSKLDTTVKRAQGLVDEWNILISTAESE
jgi:hypothetical protein